MKNVFKWSLILLLVLIGFAASVLTILWMQGRLDYFTGKHQPRQPQKKDKPVAAETSHRYFFPMPPPFSFAEVSHLTQSLQKAKANYERRQQALARERKQLQRLRQDIEQRKKEVEAMMEKLEAQITEFEMQKRQWQKQQVDLAPLEKKNFKKLAKVFANMDVEQAAERLQQMEDATAAKILFVMNERNASRILSQLKPAKVKILTRLMKKTH